MNAAQKIISDIINTIIGNLGWNASTPTLDQVYTAAWGEYDARTAPSGTLHALIWNTVSDHLDAACQEALPRLLTVHRLNRTHPAF